MKTLAVLAVFFCSLLALGATMHAQPNARVVISNGITAPVKMPDSELLAADHKDKHRPDGGSDERGEEELFPAEVDQHQALQALDPGVFDDLMRIRIAARGPVGL